MSAVRRAPTLDATDWMARGLCREDPEAWFSEEPEEIAKAIATCGRCRVQTWCDLWARRNGERVGVWAGIDRGAGKGQNSPDLGAELEATG